MFLKMKILCASCLLFCTVGFAANEKAATLEHMVSAYYRYPKNVVYTIPSAFEKSRFPEASRIAYLLKKHQQYRVEDIDGWYVVLHHSPSRAYNQIFGFYEEYSILDEEDLVRSLHAHVAAGGTASSAVGELRNTTLSLTLGSIILDAADFSPEKENDSFVIRSRFAANDYVQSLGVIDALSSSHQKMLKDRLFHCAISGGKQEASAFECNNMSREGAIFLDAR